METLLILAVVAWLGLSPDRYAKPARAAARGGAAAGFGAGHQAAVKAWEADAPARAERLKARQAWLGHKDRGRIRKFLLEPGHRLWRAGLRWGGRLDGIGVPAFGVGVLAAGHAARTSWGDARREHEQRRAQTRAAERAIDRWVERAVPGRTPMSVRTRGRKLLLGPLLDSHAQVVDLETDELRKPADDDIEQLEHEEAIAAARTGRCCWVCRRDIPSDHLDYLCSTCRAAICPACGHSRGEGPIGCGICGQARFDAAHPDGGPNAVPPGWPAVPAPPLPDEGNTTCPTCGSAHGEGEDCNRCRLIRQVRDKRAPETDPWDVATAAALKERETVPPQTCSRCGEPMRRGRTSFDSDGSAITDTYCDACRIESGEHWGWDAPEWDDETESYLPDAATWHPGSDGEGDCPGCVGRGTGSRCCMCGRPIPEHLRRQPTDADEYSPACPNCAAGKIHAHRPTSPAAPPAWGQYPGNPDQLQTAEDRWSVEAGRCRYVVSNELWGHGRRMCGRPATRQVDGPGEPCMLCDEHFHKIHGSPGSETPPADGGGETPTHQEGNTVPLTLARNQASSASSVNCLTLDIQDMEHLLSVLIGVADRVVEAAAHMRDAADTSRGIPDALTFNPGDTVVNAITAMAENAPDPDRLQAWAEACTAAVEATRDRVNEMEIIGVSGVEGTTAQIGSTGS